MKAVIIARVSTEEQREAGNSLPAQIARVKQYCVQKGFDVINVFDFDESAYAEKRPEFDKALDFIMDQKEKIAICCDKVDRLTRTVFDARLGILHNKAMQGDLELHFVSDSQVIHNKSDPTELFRFILSLGLSKLGSDTTKRHVRHGNEEKRRRGEFGSKAPYGYKNVRVGSKSDVIVDEPAASVVRSAFEWYASGAYSMSLIRHKIKEEYGVAWSKGYVDWALKNPFYYGEMRCPEGLLPHCYPPLISRALFDEVQARKAGFSKKKRKYAGLPYMYRGMIRCSVCNLAVTPGKHKGYVYYHCTQSRGNHGALWLREDRITEALGDVFKRLQFSRAIVDQAISLLAEAHKGKVAVRDQELDKIAKEQRETTTALDKLYEDRLYGRIDEERFQKFQSRLQDRLRQSTDRLSRMQEADEQYYLTVESLLKLAVEGYDLFLGSKADDRRQLLNLVLLNLRIDEEKLLWDVREPFKTMLMFGDRQEWCAR